MSLRAKDVSSSREETRGLLLPSLASLGVGTSMDADESRNATDSQGRTRLHRSCLYGDNHTVALLLRAGARVNVADADGRTPLHYACERGHADCVRLLLMHGANVDARVSRDFTPLWDACRRSHVGCVRLMLCAGADVNVRAYGENMLHKCLGLACTRLLLKHGADVNARVPHGRLTPLHFACHRDNTGHWNNLDRVKLLLQHGANVHARDSRDSTPLHHACGDGNVECARLLLQCGADVYARDNSSLMPLHWARAESSGHDKCIRLMKESMDKRHLGWTASKHARVVTEVRENVEDALRALLLAEARRAGCELSWDAAESVLRAVAS
jgi:ankyrin repeat protein